MVVAAWTGEQCVDSREIECDVRCTAELCLLVLSMHGLSFKSSEESRAALDRLQLVEGSWLG